MPLQTQRTWKNADRTIPGGVIAGTGLLAAPCDRSGHMANATTPEANQRQLMFVHINGDGLSYRQALVSPVREIFPQDCRLKFFPGHLPTLLFERMNGQLICARLIYPAMTELNLSEFICQIEQALSIQCPMENGPSDITIQVWAKHGWHVTVCGCALDPNVQNPFSKIVPELAAKNEGWRHRLALPDESGTPMYMESELYWQLNVAFSGFISRLDNRIVWVLMRCAMLDTASYNAYRSLGPTALHRRLQAAEAFPLMGAHLIEKGKPFAGLRRAVDRALPMIPVLARALDVPQEVVRWIGGKDVLVVGPQWIARLSQLAQELACFCPEHRPCSVEDWMAFNSLVTAIEQLAPLANDRQSGNRFHDSLIKELGKIGWEATLARLARIRATPADFADIGDLINEIVEVLAEDLGEGGTLTEILPDMLGPHVKRMFFSLGIFRQLETSLLWHRIMNQADHDAIDSAGNSSAPVESWPAVFDGVEEVAGLLALCLTNRMQLKEEGLHMQHCVRKYVDQCLFHGSTILSIRRSNGMRVSTVQLQLTASDSGQLHFEVRQHRGVRNALASEDAIAALNLLLLRLNSKEYLARRDYLQRAQTERKIWQRMAQSDPTDPERLRSLKTALKQHVDYDHIRAAIVPCAWPF